MTILLSDFGLWNKFLPLSYTRPLAEMRCGMMSFKERWELALNTPCFYHTEVYLSKKYRCPNPKDVLVLKASCLATEKLAQAVLSLSLNEALYADETLIAYRQSSIADFEAATFKSIYFNEPVEQIRAPWELFTKNRVFLEHDFNLKTNAQNTQSIPDFVQAINPDEIFIHPKANLNPCILNASLGPIYIDEDAEIMDGSLVRGPFYLGKSSVLKMGAKIYGATSIGPHSKVGGEVNNSIIFGYSNKAHDGFLGNAVIGEWCNLGADTNNSNLKNNYDIVKLWDYTTERFSSTGLQFCGLIMGDHSKCGINTMFNTGTVVGVSANIFGAGFPRNFIPSFSWGGAAGTITYKFEKAIEVAEKVMQRRNLQLDQQSLEILKEIFNRSEKFRRK
ncbi:MAG: GlmU family protein [Flavobacteriaceae bacterium]|nr:GlmU family protein [Flavobacteriaceae bacterium]